jgi:hypothetical protein
MLQRDMILKVPCALRIGALRHLQCSAQVAQDVVDLGEVLRICPIVEQLYRTALHDPEVHSRNGMSGRPPAPREKSQAGRRYHPQDHLHEH